MAQLKRDKKKKRATGDDDDRQLEEKLPNPVEASAVAFSVGAAVPLLAAAFVRNYRMRLGAVVAAVSVAALGRAPPVKSSLRVLIGGWVAMGITFGFTKLIGSKHPQLKFVIFV